MEINIANIAIATVTVVLTLVSMGIIIGLIFMAIDAASSSKVGFGIVAFVAIIIVCNFIEHYSVIRLWAAPVISRLGI